jgi:hypothetical protein
MLPADPEIRKMNPHDRICRLTQHVVMELWTRLIIAPTSAMSVGGV